MQSEITAILIGKGKNKGLSKLNSADLKQISKIPNPSGVIIIGASNINDVDKQIVIAIKNLSLTPDDVNFIHAESLKDIIGDLSEEIVSCLNNGDQILIVKDLDSKLPAPYEFKMDKSHIQAAPIITKRSSEPNHPYAKFINPNKNRRR